MITKHEPEGGIFIGDAPDDVLEIILSELPRDSGLVPVAQVCKRFKVLVLPLIYRNIRLEAKRMKDSDYSSLKPDDLPPGLEPDNLSLSLKKYPYLCEYVRELSLKVHNVSWYENSGGYQRLIKLLRSIQKLSLSPPPKEYIFPVSDRLTTMRLDFSYEHGRFWAPKRLNDATSFDLNQYFSKPTLCKLQFEHIERLYYNPVHTGNPGSSAIIDLRFIDWSPDKASRTLRARGSWTLAGRVGRIDAGIGAARLRSLTAATLCLPGKLIIAYSDEAYNDGRDFPPKESPVMGTLINYHNLKRLALPEPFLVSLRDASFHKLLPPQLEELQIQYPMGVRQSVMDRQGDTGKSPPYRLTRMQKLAKNKESLPRLKHVIWWFQQTSQQVSMGDPPPFNHIFPSNTNAVRMSDDPRKGPLYGPPEDMDELAENFKKVGVKFEWVSIPSFKDTPFGEYLRIQ